MGYLCLVLSHVLGPSVSSAVTSQAAEGTGEETAGEAPGGQLWRCGAAPFLALGASTGA